MAIKSLRISNLRNISDTELNPVIGNNLIWGTNGSGKTSILESIYLLARGRSFRSSRAGPLIKIGQEILTVFSQYENQNNQYRIGISKSKSATEVKINGEGISKLSQLASVLPLHIITPQSHQILERGPEFRRRLLDWGVFHVEHNYNQVLRRYLRALNQRNSALRSDQKQAQAWDTELSKIALMLNQHRMDYLDELSGAIKDEVKLFLPNFECSIEWRPGWDKEKGLLASLKDNFKSDCKRGFTQSGPQRADLILKLDNHKAAEIASRGQQKLLIAAVKIAQIKVCQKRYNSGQVFIIDDLAAELDSINLQKITNRITELAIQSFITATDKQNFSSFNIEKVFHVEHGIIQT
ncbi:MAG: DNA replication/repair protein RecF [Candidatus Sedimenticola sp. 6PFRAG7]